MRAAECAFGGGFAGACIKERRETKGGLVGNEQNGECRDLSIEKVKFTSIEVVNSQTPKPANSPFGS